MDVEAFIVFWKQLFDAFLGRNATETLLGQPLDMSAAGVRFKELDVNGSGLLDEALSSHLASLNSKPYLSSHLASL